MEESIREFLMEKRGYLNSSPRIILERLGLYPITAVEIIKREAICREITKAVKKELKIKVMKREKYPNGYVPKIEYWTGLLNTAVRENDWKGVKLCVDKLTFFNQKQQELEATIDKF